MVIEIKELSKEYGSVKALDSVNLTLSEGIHALLGPNGVGKSTLINLITDNVSRTSGQILCDGTDIRQMGAKFRSQLGYMPQQQSLYEDFTAVNFLKYIAGIKGLNVRKAKEEINILLDRVHLSSVSHRKIGGFSGGMKQRLLLAQALLGDPKVLILDEPTAGFDPMERINIRNLIKELSKDKIILYATHVVSDIECIADDIILIGKGQVICQRKPEELIGDMSGRVARIGITFEKTEELKKRFAVGNLTQNREGIYARIIRTGDDEAFPEGAEIIKDGIGLEDVYLYYFGTH